MGFPAIVGQSKIRSNSCGEAQETITHHLVACPRLRRDRARMLRSWLATLRGAVSPSVPVASREELLDCVVVWLEALPSGELFRFLLGQPQVWREAVPPALRVAAQLPLACEAALSSCLVSGCYSLWRERERFLQRGA